MQREEMKMLQVREKHAPNLSTLGLVGPGLLALVLTCTAHAQQQPAPPVGDKPSQPATAPAADCRQCHTCAHPTPGNLCLKNPCRRQVKTGEAETPAGVQGPDVLILDQIEGAYLPVPFDHKGHSQMAEMAGGCSTCHHFTPQGERPPPCRSCHDVNSSGTDIHKPGLKGAYHQQCMNCHRDWIDETDCGICHVGRKQGVAADAQATGDDLAGRVHPPIPEPSGNFYQGAMGSGAETPVVFRHQEHVQRFGLNCVECHHESNCKRCHTRNTQEDEAARRLQHHKRCLRCHKSDMDGSKQDARCDRCHWQSGQPAPKRFDHADTGWPLKQYHASVSCRACHASIPFTKAAQDCTACHTGWDADGFDHAVTGQLLDENHAEIDCAECHQGGKYDKPPACDECHDAEDDGIAFPAKRPGELVQPVPTTPAPTTPAPAPTQG